MWAHSCVPRFIGESHHLHSQVAPTEPLRPKRHRGLLPALSSHGKLCRILRYCVSAHSTGWLFTYEMPCSLQVNNIINMHISDCKSARKSQASNIQRSDIDWAGFFVSLYLLDRALHASINIPELHRDRCSHYSLTYGSHCSVLHTPMPSLETPSSIWE